ncbi:MAG TPA: YciI family protein [Bryobacteraceae bacterium]|nr:YciI family protein [Bryobacteraceae bacterium]
MKFLCIYKPSKPEVTPPTQEEMARMNKLVEESFQSGILVATEGCLPSALGARVRRSSGKYNVTDGPFTESKEIVGGFAILKLSSKQEAVEYTKRFLEVAGDGEVEIRQVYEAGNAVPGKA